MTEYKYKNETVILERNDYMYGGLAVRMWSKYEDDEYGSGWEPYAEITRWLLAVGDRSAFVDENNLPGIGEWLEANGLAINTGILMPSGYCVYPLYEFTDKFFESVA